MTSSTFGDAPQPLRADAKTLLSTKLQVLKRDLVMGTGGLALRHRLHVHSAQLRELVDELGVADLLGGHAQTIEAAVQRGEIADANAACEAFEAMLDGRSPPSLASATEAAAIVVDSSHDPQPEPFAPTVAETDQEQSREITFSPRQKRQVRRHRDPPRPVDAIGITTAGQLGDAVRQARTFRRLSQQDVATAAGVGRRFVIELEGGKVTSEVGRMLAVCQAVGLTLSASDARHGLVAP